MGSRSDDEVMTSPSPEGGDNDVLLAVSPNNRGVDRMVLTVSVTLLPPRNLTCPRKIFKKWNFVHRGACPRKFPEATGGGVI